LSRATTIRLHLFCSRCCLPLPSVVPRHSNIRHLSAERVRDPSIFSPRTIVCAASLSSIDGGPRIQPRTLRCSRATTGCEGSLWRNSTALQPMLHTASL
jgi:hypothetical protein